MSQQRNGKNEIIRHSIRSILILALAVFAPARASAQDAAMKQRIDAVIDRAIKEDRIVGLTMLVAKNGEIIYRRTAGWNDREAKKTLLKVSNGFDDLAVSLEENLRRIAAAPLLFEPGTAGAYAVEILLAANEDHSV